MENLVEQLEKKILAGESVSPAEYMEARKNKGAAKRIAELTAQGETERRKADIDALAALKLRAEQPEFTGSAGISMAYDISDLEKKIKNDTNK